MNPEKKSKRIEYWRKIIAECENSQMKKSDWLKQKSINPKTYYRWHKEIRMMDNADTDTEENNSSHQFGELLPVIHDQHNSSASIHIGNAEIMIDNAMSDELLIKIIRAISNV